jgi:hypothetical protein
MRCYFLRDGHLAGVEMLPLGLSDEDAIAWAHILSSKRKGPLDGLEVGIAAARSSGVLTSPRRCLASQENGSQDCRNAAQAEFDARGIKADNGRAVVPAPRCDATGLAFASRRITSL